MGSNTIFLYMIQVYFKRSTPRTEQLFKKLFPRPLDFQAESLHEKLVVPLLGPMWIWGCGL